MRQTPLNAEHRAAGARLVGFAGWELPLHYGSQIEEHHAVRRDAGVFDTSQVQGVQGGQSKTPRRKLSTIAAAQPPAPEETPMFRKTAGKGGQGVLSKGHPVGATGAIQIHELVLRLRGEAAQRQAHGARLAAAENGGGFHDGEEAIAAVSILSR